MKTWMDEGMHANGYGEFLSMSDNRLTQPFAAQTLLGPCPCVHCLAHMATGVVPMLSAMLTHAP